MPLRAARLAPVVGLLAAASVIPVATLVLTEGHMVMASAQFHAVVAGVAGLVTAVAAAALSVSALHRHDGRVVLLGTAFAAMAVMLIFHALATPGLILHANGVVALAGGLNLPVGGVILAASALPALRHASRARDLVRAELGIVATIVVVGTLLFAFPGVLPTLPDAGSLPACLLFAVGATILGVLAWRAARTFLLTRRPADLLVAVGLVCLGGAQFGMLDFTMMDAPWWAAHGLEVGGLALVGIPAALDLRQAVASHPLVGDLRPADLVHNEEAFLGSTVRALMVRLGEKDHSTEGHTRRVATLAVQIGEQLGLPESRLRLLALGGLLHDMGKLSVPDAILKKPGALNDDEFAVIRRHPVWGRELLLELGGFPPLVLELVESHHERIDGGGYPNNAPAGELDLEVRVLTVADVYDALTDDRVYRSAWPSERALALLEDGIGTAFDGDCVTALRAVVAPPEPAPSWQARLADPLPAAPRPAARQPRPAS